LTSYSNIVSDIQVTRLRREPRSYEILGILFLNDESELHFKDYFFEDGSRKYAYHWQTQHGEPLGRWDNAPHWTHSETFPHHFHNMLEGTVEDSRIRNLESVLEYLKGRISEE
jgi:hypothetical protein